MKKEQMVGFLLLALTFSARAISFSYITTTDNTITITGYIGTGSEIVIPSTIENLPVTSIDSFAFDGMRELTNVTIQNGITYIGQSAFQNCTSLTSLTLPASVISIENFAFNNCSGLTGTMEIPAGVTSIGVAAFQGCSGLTSFEVDPSNTTYMSENGIIFSKDQSTLVLCPMQKTGDYTIPASVSSVESSAFHGCSGLTGTMVISSNVTTIGASAFQGCSGLVAFDVDDANTAYMSEAGVLFNKDQTTLMQCPEKMTGTYTIPTSVTRIEDFAFYNCNGLTGNMTIPDGVSYIGLFAFFNCSGLTDTMSFPSSVTFIHLYAFNGCSGLTGVTIPESVSFIGPAAFWGCNSIVSFEVDSENIAFSSEDGVLFNKNKTKLIVCPAQKTGEYTIPASVTKIESAAFYNCSGLTGTLTIPAGVTAIENDTFYNCSGLTGTLTIPTNVERIGSQAFYNCSGLTGTLTIPSSVSLIGSYAFYNCSGLTGTLTVPGNVAIIGTHAFLGCSGISSFYVPPGTSNYKSIDDILYHYFEGRLIQCPEQKTGGFSIYHRTVTIEDYAFYNCSQLTGSLNIPSGAITIGTRAFQNCNGLTSLMIPSSVTDIGESAFQGCNSLVSFEVDSQNLNYSSTGGILFDKDQTRLIQCIVQTMDNYTVPSTVNSIERGAFHYCDQLTKVYFLGEAPFIPDDAFTNSANVTLYYMPKILGWPPTIGGRPTAEWKPQIQVGDATFGPQSHGFVFNITGPNDFTFVMEACTNLVNPIWFPLNTNSIESGSASFNDPTMQSHSRKYYRLRMP